MSMICCALNEADLEECLAIDPRSTGEAIVGRPASRAVWKDLLKRRTFNSVIIAVHTPAGRRQIVSFGASLFVSAAFAAHAVNHPAPDLNSRIFAGIADGNCGTHAEASMKEPGATDPLDLVLLCSSFLHEALDREQQEEVSVLLPHALVHLHTGYRIGRILMETTNERMRSLAALSGIWKTIARFPAEDRALMAVTEEEVRSSAGFTVLAPLFRYHAPLLALRDTEKQLLAEALNGGTDAELAVRLHLTLSSVKKRWSSLFTRVGEMQHDWFPQGVAEHSVDHRGLQKRHYILAYVRSHPEEIRPFRSYPGWV